MNLLLIIGSIETTPFRIFFFFIEPRHRFMIFSSVVFLVVATFRIASKSRSLSW
jgi:hypothetical protein